MGVNFNGHAGQVSNRAVGSEYLWVGFSGNKSRLEKSLMLPTLPEALTCFFFFYYTPYKLSVFVMDYVYMVNYIF